MLYDSVFNYLFCRDIPTSIRSLRVLNISMVGAFTLTSKERVPYHNSTHSYLKSILDSNELNFNVNILDFPSIVVYQSVCDLKV